jgi:ammonium transporter, Amt family
MLTSVALVLMMTIPGLGLFYGGMVRKKNVGDTVMASFAITCLVTVIWTICTYSMAFTPGTPFIGGFDRAFLQGILSDISKGMPNPLAATIPEMVYICFQMTFAIITPALIAGAYAERMKFSAMLWFMGLWAIVVYAPIAHWVWGPDGFLNSANSDAIVKVLDFAGGTVVHINAGVADEGQHHVVGGTGVLALAEQERGHQAGAALLWVGWFGFNAGSAVTAGLQAGNRGARLDVRRMGVARQADGGRHLLRRSRRPRRHHAGLWPRRAGWCAGDRCSGGGGVLLGRHGPQAHVRL